MNARAQCVLGFLSGAAIDLTLYAGVYAALVAAIVATGALLWRQLR